VESVRFKDHLVGVPPVAGEDGGASSRHWNGGWSPLSPDPATAGPIALVGTRHSSRSISRTRRGAGVVGPGLTGIAVEARRLIHGPTTTTNR
jgi:hypothetical protein